MKNIYALKSELDDLQGLNELTESLTYMSAAKMAKVRDKVLQTRNFLEEALKAKVELQRYIVISENKQRDRGKKKQDKRIRRTLVMAIMSDQGLCGSFNSQLGKLVTQNLHKQDVDLLIIGKRGASFIRDAALRKNMEVVPLPKPDDPQSMRPIFDKIARYDIVQLYYNKFITAIKTEPTDLFYKSLGDAAVAQKLEKIKLDGEDESLEYVAKTMVVEPSVNEVERFFETVITEAAMLHQMLESQLSENNARMLAMKEASDNIVELVRKQKRLINTTRRKKINQALSELFGAMMIH